MKQKPRRQSDGALSCARYAFKPNQLQYCGPDQNKELNAYIEAETRDAGLDFLLQRFETLFPYLELIAKENKIQDPFDERVVKAYWLGNNLLKNVRKGKFFEHLADGLVLKKKLSNPMMGKLVEKVRTGAPAHHSFHVFNIWKRTGFVESPHTLFTMDECRIGWGQVLRADRKKIEVMCQPLEFNDRKLCFGNWKNKDITIDEKGEQIKKGDWISFHWSSFCDKLSAVDLTNLENWTSLSMAVYNKQAK